VHRVPSVCHPLESDVFFQRGIGKSSGSKIWFQHFTFDTTRHYCQKSEGVKDVAIRILIHSAKIFKKIRGKEKQKNK
jgi:hypothetical protein